MKLYTAGISPFAARCRMQIYAKGLDIEFLEYPTDISKEDIVSASPIGKIPVLLDGNVVIPESDVICSYLEECFPEPSLLPDNPAERGRVRILCRIADLYIMAPLTPLFGHLSRKRRDQGIVDAGIAQIRQGLESLDHFLDDGDFAVNNRLSIADCCLVPVLFFGVTYLPYFDIAKPLESYPSVLAYWDAITQNIHAQKVIQEITDGIAAKAKK